MVAFALKNVPYYRDLAGTLGLSPRDVQTPDDLRRLPLLTRSDVRDRYADLCPDAGAIQKYEVRSTGGTTGTPMTYRLARNDRFLGAAIMYRGWGYAGYRPGDSVVALGGRSLGIIGKPGAAARLQGMARNLTKLSAFDMSEPALDSYVACINRVRPAFVRGYPGALQVLSQRVLEKRATVWSPRAMFTTSEMLLPHVRASVQEAFGCPVFDGYGLNDGGVSAYECETHDGLHVDTERSILQLVDDQGDPVRKGIGRIVATTLTNYAMPLLRYDTGDMGETDEEAVCTCGRTRPLLKRVLGRSTDVLVTPEGTKVHGWFFLYMFWDLGKGVREYQVVQETVRDITIRMVVGSDFDRTMIDRVQDAIRNQSPGWVVRIELVDSIPRTIGGKVKFIESRVQC
jgi:phenylacetate-CoA ligase